MKTAKEIAREVGIESELFEKFITSRFPNELRKAGYKITTSSLGYQVTNYGLIKTTMVSIWNADDKVQDIVKGRDFYSRKI